MVLNKCPKEIPCYDKVRPINITSIILKVLDIIIYRKLRHYCESQNLISENQTGFRKGKEILTNISSLISDAA